MSILKSVPTAAVVFLFVVLVSPRQAPILVTMLISFPILFEAISSGIKNVPEGPIQAAKIDGANLIKTNLKIKIPLALPYIGVGILSSFSLSFKVEIMAEVITGSTKDGLGCLIRACSDNDPTNMVPIFGYSLIAVILVLLISLLADFAKNKIRD